MSKTKTAAKKKSTRKENRKASAKKSSTKLKPAPTPNCPYRGMYGVLFSEGAKDYIAKDELLAKVSKLTGKPIKSIGFAFDVLKSQGHRSNGGRSTILTEGDKIKLMAVKKTVH